MGRTTRRGRVTGVIWEAGDVSSTPTPSEDATPATRMPTSVRVAVIVMSLLAGLLLLYAGLTWVNREQAIDTLVRSGGLSRSDAGRVVLTWVIPFAVLGIVLAVSAWSLPRRQPWARWVGLSAVVLLGLLILLFTLASGGATVLSLLLIVLCVAGVSSLLSRTTAAWIPRLRGP